MWWRWKRTLVLSSSIRNSLSFLKRNVSYTQGQYNPDNAKIREYFYYVDHNGFLFLDDSRMKNFTSAFKDPVFLTFFFRNLKNNPYPGEYKDPFPYVSLCGVERNYTRCDDLPIVFTKLVGTSFYYNYSDKLHVQFQPELLEVKEENGRLYHPTFLPPPKPPKGLVRSQLAIEWSPKLIYDEKDKTRVIGINWEGERVLFANK